MLFGAYSDLVGFFFCRWPRIFPDLPCKSNPLSSQLQICEGRLWNNMVRGLIFHTQKTTCPKLLEISLHVSYLVDV